MWAWHEVVSWSKVSNGGYISHMICVHLRQVNTTTGTLQNKKELTCWQALKYTIYK